VSQAVEWGFPSNSHSWQRTDRIASRDFIHVAGMGTFVRNYFKLSLQQAVKGTVSQDGLAFDDTWYVLLVLGLNRGRGHFFDFLGATMIL
jgi:hypothetical protein